MKYSAICIALYDYQAQGDEEISFSADSVLYILDKEDPDWYKAQLKVPVNQDGPVGLIPANYIENAKPIGSVTAVYDYTAQSEEELSFKQDEVLTLYEKDDPDWFIVASSKGDIGLAPSNYIEETKTVPVAKKEEPVKQKVVNKPIETKPLSEAKWAIALYSFTPESAEETKLEEHEQVLVTDHSTSKDWWTIEHKDGAAGLVPANYIKFQDEYEADLLKEEQENKMKNETASQQALATQEKQRKGEVESRAKERQKELAERDYRKEQEDKENARQQEVERRRKMQEEAKQKEIDAKRQATFAANAASSPSQFSGGSPRRSDIPAPPPPIVHSDPNKPDPARVRLWTDRTGAFKVEAQFISCANGKIRLHKTNGVKIDVPTQKMCTEDLRYVEHETGLKLIETKDDNAPLGQPNFNWVDYLKRANIPHTAAVQYARDFDQNQLSEQDIERLTYRAMKTLGMSERHVQRLQKYIETKHADPPSDDESSRPKLKGKKSVTFGAVSYIEHDDGNDEDDVQWQIEQDERLAKELQEQEQQYHGNSVGLNRRGTARPTAAQSAPTGVNVSVLTPQRFQSEPLKPTPSPLQQQKPLQPLPAATNNVPTPPKSNFADDAWAPRASSSPSIQSVSSPAWNQQRSVVSSTPPQMPPRQRPTAPLAQQSLVDPQLLAKWGGSPALAAANVNRPVPPPPASSTTSLNSLSTGQPSFYQQQPMNNGSFTTLQQQQQPINNGSFTNLQQQQPVNNGSFTGFQQQQPTGYTPNYNGYQATPQFQSANSNFVPQQQNVQSQNTGYQAQTNYSPQNQMYHNLAPSNPSYMGSSPSLVPLQSVLPPALTPQQPQMTGASWSSATPNNPFGGTPQQSYVQPQQYTPIDPNDKYSVFKTVNTSTPSVFNSNNNQRF